MTKGERISYAIDKELCRNSLVEWCEEWEIDMDDYEKQTATLKLLAELAKGEQSAAEQGWLSSEDVERELGLL